MSNPTTQDSYPAVGAPGNVGGDGYPAPQGGDPTAISDMPLGIIPRLLDLRDDIVELLLLLGITDESGQGDQSQNPDDGSTGDPNQADPYADVPDSATTNSPYPAAANAGPRGRMKSLAERLSSIQ